MRKDGGPKGHEKIWMESAKLEEARVQLAQEFDAQRMEILSQISMAKDRLDEMTSNTIKKIESELPDKISAIENEQENKYVKAMAEIDKFKEALSCLPLDAMIERSFLAISGLAPEEEG